MGKKLKRKKKKSIFSGIRKPLAKPTKVFKTRKGENDRKQKHKKPIEVDRSE